MTLARSCIRLGAKCCFKVREGKTVVGGGRGVSRRERGGGSMWGIIYRPEDGQARPKHVVIEILINYAT